MFDKRRDLFADLSAVLVDTASLSFNGEGGETLGEHGYSNDYRPDLKQMIFGADRRRKWATNLHRDVAGSPADVTILLPVVDRLRQRFSIGRVCVADCGMISAATIEGLGARKATMS